MEPLELPAHPDSSHHKTPKPAAGSEKPVQITTNAEGQNIPVRKLASRWFNPDSIENLTNKECVIRGCCVMLLPMSAAIDWSYGTYSMALIIPVIFYLEFTAFTMYCPIKRLFSNYSHPTKVE